MSEKEPRRIAWIGTGVMGAPMAGHLIDAGYELTITTRSREKAEPLLARGAQWADDPAAAASGADAAFSMVSFPRDVEDVHLGDRGTLRADPRPRVIVDMTTSDPLLAGRIHADARQLAVGSVDAPVSGGDVGAREARLSIMVGGEDDDVECVRPVMEHLGRQIVHQGGPGAGQHTKMVNQILIATNMIGVCEGLVYAEQAGLDPDRVLESVASGAAGSWSVSNLGPRMIKRDFEPGFYVEHFVKDLRIALDQSQQLGLTLPGLELAKNLYDTAVARGLDRAGTQALFKVVQGTDGSL